MTNTRSDWEQRFQSLTIESRAFIDGQYRAALSGETFECISPVDGRFLANVASTEAINKYGLASAPATRCSMRTASEEPVGTRTATVRLSMPQLGEFGT